MPVAVTHRLRQLLPVLLLALLVALLYGQTLQAPWYLDDQRAILENRAVMHPGWGISQFFTPRGLTYLSFALNYQLAGWALPGFHLVNIIIHLGCGGLVFLLLRRVFRNDPFAPLCGALLFVAHPLQTQAVTYIAQRMTSLSAFFFFLALYLFIRSRELLATGAAHRSARYLAFYLSALTCGGFALFAKENAAVLPLALVLFTRFFIPEERSWRPLLRVTAPFLIAPLALAMATLIMPLARGETIATITAIPSLAHLQGNSPLRYLLTEFSVYWIYLRLLLIPVGQAFEHGYPVVQSLFSVQTTLAGGGLLLLGWLGWRLRHERPRLTFAIAWFFLTLIIESSIIPLDPLFEHRLYLPLFGFVIALLDLATFIPRRTVARGLLLLALVTCAILTWQRNALWNDPVALYKDSLRQAPDNERTLINLSSHYIDSGKIAEAEELALQSLTINPRYPYVYRNLARIHLDRNETDKALSYLASGAQFPELTASDELYTLSAKARMQQGRPDLAAGLLLKALTFQQDAMTYNNLGTAYSNLGRWQEAEQSYYSAMALNPAEILPHANLARLLRQQGRLQEALREYRISLGMAPQRADLRDEAEQIQRLLGQ